MLSRWGGRPGKGGGFESNHRPLVGFFDRFNGLSSNILLTFSCYFDNPQCPGVGHLNGNSQRSSNAPPMPSLPHQRLNIDRCIKPCVSWKSYIQLYILCTKFNLIWFIMLDPMSYWALILQPVCSKHSHKHKPNKIGRHNLGVFSHLGHTKNGALLCLRWFSSKRTHHRFPLKFGMLMLHDKEILKT